MNSKINSTINYRLKTFEKGEQNVAFKDALKGLKPLLSDEKISIFLALMAILINSSANLIGPVVIAHTIDTYIATKNFYGVLSLSGILAIIYIIGLVASYLQVKVMGGVGRRLLFKLRNAIFTKLQELPVAFFNANKAGDLISRINNDTDKLNQFFSQALVQFVGNVFIMLGAAIFLLSLNLRLGVSALVPAYFTMDQTYECKKLAISWRTIC
jgi:ATP-binding cassette subfamily B protein